MINKYPVKLSFLFLLLFITSEIFPQNKNLPLAEFNFGKLSTKEFTQRFEMMPHPGVDIKTDSAKIHFLLTIIAEKLWAEDAIEKGYGNNPRIKKLTDQLEKLYARDALYKDSIDSRISFSDSAIANQKMKRSTTLKALVLSSRDSSKIFNDYRSLNAGAKFDSLLTVQNNSKEPNDTLAINYGLIENEDIENILYSTKVNHYTFPVENKNIWFLFKIVDRYGNVGNQTKKEDLHRIKEITRERAAKKIGIKYLQNLLGKEKVDINDDLFYKFSKICFDIISEKYKDNKKDEDIYLSGSDIPKVLNKLSDEEAAKPFIIFKENPVSINYLLNYVSFFPVKFDKISKETIQYNLKSYLDTYIRQELISREALRLGYQNRPNVKSEVEIWRDNFLAKLTQNSYLDSIKVTESELHNYYLELNRRNEKLEKIKIIEIFTKKLHTVEKVLDELDKGKDFKELAKEYNERPSTKKTGGVYDYFPVNEHGQFGKIAAKMKIGEVYGPMKLRNGYSIIKLIDKKKADSLAIEPFDKVKNQIEVDYKMDKLKPIFNKHTVQLAQKYGLKINLEKLKSLKLSTINMFTFKYIGFGGKIAAVPYTTEMYKWFNLWKEKKDLNP